VALGQAEAETIVVVDADGAYNLMAKAESQPEEEHLHNLEEEEDILLLMKLADSGVDENEMNWKNEDCAVKEHGSFVAVAAVGHKLQLKRMTRVHGDD
jgi:hypothetical protein